MCRVVRDYFTSMFTLEDQSEEVMMAGHRMVTAEQNRLLTEEFRSDEFTLAIKQMHPDKAVGPDGLNPGFFQHFWSILGHEVYKFCTNWLRDTNFPGELNNTNVVLIPKKENAASMKDLRPITLCNVLYKILAKILANRLPLLLFLKISRHL